MQYHASCIYSPSLLRLIFLTKNGREVGEKWEGSGIGKWLNVCSRILWLEMTIFYLFNIFLPIFILFPSHFTALPLPHVVRK